MPSASPESLSESKRIKDHVFCNSSLSYGDLHSSCLASADRNMRVQCHHSEYMYRSPSAYAHHDDYCMRVQRLLYMHSTTCMYYGQNACTVSTLRAVFTITAYAMPTICHNPCTLCACSMVDIHAYTMRMAHACGEAERCACCETASCVGARTLDIVYTYETFATHTHLCFSCVCKTWSEVNNKQGEKVNSAPRVEYMWQAIHAS